MNPGMHPEEWRVMVTEIAENVPWFVNDLHNVERNNRMNGVQKLCYVMLVDVETKEFRGKQKTFSARFVLKLQSCTHPIVCCGCLVCLAQELLATLVSSLQYNLND